MGVLHVQLGLQMLYFQRHAIDHKNGRRDVHDLGNQPWQVQRLGRIGRAGMNTDQGAVNGRAVNVDVAKQQLQRREADSYLTRMYIPVRRM